MSPHNYHPDFSPTLQIVGLVALVALLFGVIAHSTMRRSVVAAVPSPETQALVSQPTIP